MRKSLLILILASAVIMISSCHRNIIGREYNFDGDLMDGSGMVVYQYISPTIAEYEIFILDGQTLMLFKDSIFNFFGMSPSWSCIGKWDITADTLVLHPCVLAGGTMLSSRYRYGKEPEYNYDMICGIQEIDGARPLLKGEKYGKLFRFTPRWLITGNKIVPCDSNRYINTLYRLNDKIPLERTSEIIIEPERLKVRIRTVPFDSVVRNDGGNLL